MRDNGNDTPKSGAVIVIISAVVLALAGVAYMGYRATVTHVVDRFYGNILTSRPARPESYPTEAARLERSQKVLAVWRGVDQPTLSLEELSLDMPLPLRMTRTTHLANPEHLQKQARAVFARDLAALSGRRVVSATLSAWEAEIAAWDAAHRDRCALIQSRCR
jgi:hypothetical protein